MKAVFRKAAALGLVFAMSCTALAGCGSKGSKIDGSKTLMTVNGEDVDLPDLQHVFRNNLDL